MKFAKGMFALAAGVALSGAARAQDAAVSAEKQSPLKALLPGVYGKVEVRNTHLRANDADNDLAYVRLRQEVLPTLGTTLFNDKVDTAFTWRFQHAASTNTIKRYDVYNESQWNIISGKFNENSPYNFGPYSFVDLMTESPNTGFLYADLGVYGEVNYEIPVSSGAVSFQGFLNPYGEFVNTQYARDHLIKAEDRLDRKPDQYGLTSNPDGTVSSATGQQRDPKLINDFGVMVTYKPKLVDGFSVAGKVEVIQTWDPQYVAKPGSGRDSADMELDHYAVGVLTANRLILGYKINDRVSVGNQLRYYGGGFNTWHITTDRQDPTGNVGPYSWENRVTLNATLF